MVARYLFIDEVPQSKCDLGDLVDLILLGHVVDRGADLGEIASGERQILRLGICVEIGCACHDLDALDVVMNSL